MLFREIIVDNFAGGGGASTGIELATGRSVDAAINHDLAAINMHSMNHPDTKHYCESVWDVDPVEVAAGRPIGLAWFSPDCKHFSKAKGGAPVNKEIRGLAWVTLRWALKVRPRVMMLENVEEFQTWGPLVRDLKGELKPCPDRRGDTFRAFVAILTTGLSPREPGFLEACRFLGVEYDLQAKLKMFKGLGYQVEWKELRASDYGTPTIRKRLFMVMRCDGQPIKWPKPTHGDPNSKEVKRGKLKPWLTAADCIDWSIPCPSIFERKRPLAEKTLKRIGRGLKKFVIEAERPFIVDKWLAPIIARQFGNSTGHSMDVPMGTVTAGGGGKSQLVAAFLAKHYGGNYTGPGASLEAPAPTVTTVDHNALVTSHLVKLRGTCQHGQPVTEPMPTVTAGGLHVGEVRAFLLKYYGTNIGQPVDDPLQTITTKHRFGLVTIQGQDYQIVDIGMRMLEPHELFAAQGFPTDYIIDVDPDGKRVTKEKQIARCGNSVCPPLAEALVRVNLPEMCVERVAA
ncbi:DNA cytosine methyltransferase [Oceanisphaera sp. KMM 10153]|uniref:DNA cytosine methyltransferase n=1 Tax=Oceanisphaera submarina TaxID=3390193 RepID=UPI0039759E89